MSAAAAAHFRELMRKAGVAFLAAGPSVILEAFDSALPARNFSRALWAPGYVFFNCFGRTVRIGFFNKHEQLFVRRMFHKVNVD
jgi:hypothetical protein